MKVIDPWKSYRQVSVQTASPGQLILMLYDGAIRFLERALLGFDCEDPAEFHQTIHNNVHRAQEVLDELDFALNLKEGGELGMSLHRLYEYMNDRLHESNVKKTEGGIRDTIRRLSILRQAWAKMLEGQNLEGDRLETGSRLVAVS